MTRLQDPKPFTGNTVNDVVRAYLELLWQYRQGQIKHNELVNWINKDLSE